MSEKLKFISSGDSALFCRFSETISIEYSGRVIGLHNYLKENPRHGIVETVPSYTGLMIYYDPLLIALQDVKDIAGQFSEHHLTGKLSVKRRSIRIPVCYGSDYGPDLESVAARSNLTPEKVIEIHSAPDYLVYMLGFTPGFPYLGGLDRRIATPRHDKPRLKIRAGSVGIAGDQTGIYPIESPGGWQVIGRTPLVLFNPIDSEPFLFKAGDIVKFYSISLNDYLGYSELIRSGSYKREISYDQ